MYIQKCKVQLDKSIIHNFLINFFWPNLHDCTVGPNFYDERMTKE